MSPISTYFRAITIVAVIVFVGTLILGVNINSQFSSSTNGCLFDSSEACMGVGEHILEWQNTFNISPENNILILVSTLLLTLGSLLFVAVPSNILYRLFEWHEKYIFIYIREWKEVPVRLFDFIRLFLSNGILHPKLF